VEITDPLRDKITSLVEIDKQTLVEHAIVDGRAVTVIMSIDGAAGDLFRLGVLLLRQIAKMVGEAELDEATKPKIDPTLN
jgi:hypothetical protein